MRMPLPDAIANAPNLNFGLHFYYCAFWDLSTCRNSGWSEGPIPWTAMERYCAFYELNSEESQDLIYLMSKMDEQYLKMRKDKAETKTAT